MAEILAINIKSNSDIVEITIDGKTEPEKIEQYADDTTLWSLYSQKLVNAILDELDKFYLNTGLKVNYKKSMLYKVGSAKNKPNLKLSKNIKWAEKTLECLGVIIQLDDLNDIQELSYESAIEKMFQTLTAWQNRSLSVIGKIQVINSLCNSMFVYHMQVMPKMKPEILA